MLDLKNEKKEEYAKKVTRMAESLKFKVGSIACSTDKMLNGYNFLFAFDRAVR